MVVPDALFQQFAQVKGLLALMPKLSSQETQI
jgi:hypothetical protein